MLTHFPILSAAFAFIFALQTGFCSAPGGTAQKDPPCIVLGIADGTSQELLTAARIWSGGVESKLALEAFPQSAIVKTYSASDLVTDSAAGATAWARGIKCDNRVIGQATATSESSPPSLLDIARAAGWSTAVITDDSVTGATPTPFLIEHADRDQFDAIASKIIEQLGKRADIVLGGGSQWFADLTGTPGITPYKNDQRAQSEKNATHLESLPVRHFTSWQAFEEGTRQPGDKRPILGTFAPDVCPFYVDGVRNFRLVDMVRRSVELLRARGKPFLLVFEAGLPDKAAHLNNAKRAVAEVLEFDATLDWLRKNLGPNALILATTDHNNGGFTINGPPAPHRWSGDVLLGENPVTKKSTLTWASGPGADRNSANAKRDPADPEYTQPALLNVSSSFHSGGDVWLLANGPGSERVHGYFENTDVYGLIKHEIQVKSEGTTHD